METPDVFKDPTADSVNIDTVFQNIKTIYSDNMLELLYHGLVLLENCEEIYKPYYIDGLLKLTTPTNDQIRKWIREKLTC